MIGFSHNSDMVCYGMGMGYVLVVSLGQANMLFNEDDFWCDLDKQEEG